MAEQWQLTWVAWDACALVIGRTGADADGRCWEKRLKEAGVEPAPAHQPPLTLEMVLDVLWQSLQ